MTASSRPVLILLHFLGGSSRSWAAVTAALPSGIDAMAVDLPGFGDAADTPGYDVAAMADHVAATMRGIPGDGPIVLVGHSMGAKVAMALARRSEDGDLGLMRLRGLVLVAGSPPAPEPMAEEKRRHLLSLADGAPAARRAAAEAFIDANTAEALPAAVRHPAVEDVLRAHPAAWRAWLAAGSLEDWADRVGRLRLPVLVLAGADDAALGPAAQRETVAAHCPEARLVVLAGTGHLLPLEAPARVAALLAEQLAGIARADAMIPPAYRALIDSPRVGAATRAVLLARAAAHPATPLLDDASRRTLAALLARLVPARGEDLDLVAALDRDLGGDRGWRFAALPGDRDAMVAGLRTLDAAARHDGGFAALVPAAQDRLIAAAAEGALRPTGALLDAASMRLWLQDCHAAAVRAAMAHPVTLARIGYSGIANGGDGPRKQPRTILGEDEAASWEPLPEPAR